MISYFLLIGFVGVLSFLASCFVIFTTFRFNLYERSIYRFIACLAFSDLLQSFSGFLQFFWVSDGVHIGPLCTLQGFLFNVGDTASTFWTLAIAIKTTVSLFYAGWNENTFEIVANIVSWGIPLFLSIYGFIIETAEIPFYTSVGPWCWINKHYILERFTFHYIWIYIAMCTLPVIYGFNYIKLKRIIIENEVLQKLNKNNTKTIKKARQLMWYPFVYFCVYFPMALDRPLRAFGIDLPIEYLIFAACVFLLNGLGNGIVYGINRNLFRNYKRDSVCCSFQRQ